jgi:predicted esterase
MLFKIDAVLRRYDITSLDDRAQQPCTGIEESKAAITTLVEEEISAGIPADRIVIGGFSQGGAMALYAGLQYPSRLAGVLCLSGYLAHAEGDTPCPHTDSSIAHMTALLAHAR